jgi:hypothetical protein
MSTTTVEKPKMPTPEILAQQARRRKALGEMSERGAVLYASGNLGDDMSVGTQMDKKSHEALLAFREQLIADEVSGATHNAVVAPVETQEAAVAAFGGADTAQGRWGGILFSNLTHQGFTASTLEFQTDTVIPRGDGHSVIEIDNQPIYLLNELRDDAGERTAVVAEPIEYKYGNATLIWRVDSGVPLFEALDPNRGRKHARTNGKCRAVNHTTHDDGTPDYEGHLRRINERLEEPVERFLRAA